jgi:hypothetical protein
MQSMRMSMNSINNFGSGAALANNNLKSVGGGGGGGQVSHSSSVYSGGII